MNDENVLRDEVIGGYRLQTWDCGCMRGKGPQWQVGYRLSDPTGEVIFEGEDFGCSPLHAIDSDECCAAIMGFLTLRPGDTDAEYFEHYTKRQMKFAEEEAETLGYEVLCLMEEDEKE